jgi:hypothetical protein
VNAIVVSVIAIAPLVLVAQRAPSGVEVIVKVEARRLAGHDATEQSIRVMESQMPDGAAEVRYVTDGQAVRSTMSGRAFGLGPDTVRLVPHGSQDLYLLNPASGTYSRQAAGSRPFSGQKPEFHFQATATTRTILGYRARQVTGSYRVALPPFPGQRQYVEEMRLAIENWCTSILDIPVAMTRMMDVTRRLVGPDVEYHRACPLALQSTVTMSVLPGFEIVSTVTSIRRLSQFPGDMFRVPTDYKEISKDGGGTSR